MKGFKQDHFTMLPSVHEPSLTKNQSVLANSSKRHHNFVTLKAAHSPQREKRPGQPRGLGAPKGRRERNLYCYMHHTSKESQKNFCVSCSSWSSFKARNAQNSFKTLWYNLPACSRAGVCSLIRAGKSFATQFIFQIAFSSWKEQKHNKKTRPGQSLPQPVGIIRPWNQHMQWTKPQPTCIYTNIASAHIHVNHEN